jgi:hypothetical protein
MRWTSKLSLLLIGAAGITTLGNACAEPTQAKVTLTADVSCDNLRVSMFSGKSAAIALGKSKDPYAGADTTIMGPGARRRGGIVGVEKACFAPPDPKKTLFDYGMLALALPQEERWKEGATGALVVIVERPIPNAASGDDDSKSCLEIFEEADRTGAGGTGATATTSTRCLRAVATFKYEKNTPIPLTIHFADSCFGKVCTDKTCINGGCVDTDSYTKDATDAGPVSSDSAQGGDSTLSDSTVRDGTIGDGTIGDGQSATDGGHPDDSATDTRLDGMASGDSATEAGNVCPDGGPRAQAGAAVEAGIECNNQIGAVK